LSEQQAHKPTFEKSTADRSAVLVSEIWREQGDANTYFLKKPLIGKQHCMAPFILNLDIFRVGGIGAEKNLSALPQTL
jgi:hypothetical protein